MDELLPYLGLLALLLSCSAFFSGSEVAFFSLRRSDRELLGRSENRRDRLILRLIEKPRRLLATLLIGNESINIALSAVMAGVVERFGVGDNEVQAALYATFIALPLLLFFGEITPKTIAIGTATRWARKAARPLWLFSVLVTPIRLVVRTISEQVLKLLGAGSGEAEAEISEEEFKVLVDASSAEGEVNGNPKLEKN